MASVEIRNVRKRFGAVEVLHGINVEVADEEFVALVGASGCGKSTLLRIIAGLETVSDGEIMIDGRAVTEVPPKHRDIAMVFQNYALYPNMNVFQNMAFGLKLRGTDRETIARQVQEAAEILSITDLMLRYPRQLSGGQRQRVAMGRAIVRHPQAFLFDEPLSNLDAKLRVQMRAEIKALHQRLRTTMIYVTHDQVEAITMADRIVVMRDGHIDQVGAPLEVYDYPRNLYVAGFIGSPAMNFIPGVLKRNGSAAWLETREGTRLPAPPDVVAEEGLQVTYGIRPEHLAVTGANEDLPAKVEVVEPMGAETLVLSNIGGHQVRVLLRERRIIQPGENLTVRPDLENVHLFDSRTGQRLKSGKDKEPSQIPLDRRIAENIKR